MKKFSAVALVAGLLAAPTATLHAAPVYLNDVPMSGWSGTRSVAGGGLIANNNWALANRNATLSYAVTWDGTKFTYRYDWSTSRSTGLSHFDLELSANCANAMSSCVRNVTSSLGAGGSASGYSTFPGNSEGGFPANTSFGGIKFDQGAQSWWVQFESDRAPIWGNFYAKGGQGTAGDYAYNKGLANLSSDNTAWFIATPDTKGYCDLYDCEPPCDSPGGVPCEPNIVPEPTSFALMFGGLLGLGVAARRRRHS